MPQAIVPPTPSSKTESDTRGAAISEQAREILRADNQLLDKTWLQAFQRSVFSFAVWLLYVPHLSLVRALGPRWSMHWVGLVANLHWLLTFVGLQRRALIAIREASPYLACPYGPRSILRKHLIFKHRCFAELHSVNRRPSDKEEERDLTRRIDPAEAQEFTAVCDEQKGVIVIGYHFGCYRWSMHLAKVFPSTVFCQVRSLESRYACTVSGPVAEFVIQQKLELDQKADCEVMYLRPGVTPIELPRRLRRKEALVFAADGTFAARFIDVPFLGGKMGVPCGWAHLAAVTGAPVVVAMECASASGEREFRLHKVIRIASRSEQDIRDAVEQATSVLEVHIRAQPWEWHPWQRVKVSHEEGERRYQLLSATE